MPTLPLDLNYGLQSMYYAENAILADCPLMVLRLGKRQADALMCDMETQRRIVWALRASTWTPWMERSLDHPTLEYALDATNNGPAGDDGEFVLSSGGMYYHISTIGCFKFGGGFGRAGGGLVACGGRGGEAQRPACRHRGARQRRSARPGRSECVF